MQVEVLTIRCAEDPEYLEVSVHTNLGQAAMAACDGICDELLGKGVTRRESLTAEEIMLIHSVADALMERREWRENGYEYVVHPYVASGPPREVRWGRASVNPVAPPAG